MVAGYAYTVFEGGKPLNLCGNLRTSRLQMQERRCAAVQKLSFKSRGRPVRPSSSCRPLFAVTRFLVDCIVPVRNLNLGAASIFVLPGAIFHVFKGPDRHCRHYSRNSDRAICVVRAVFREELHVTHSSFPPGPFPCVPAEE